MSLGDSILNSTKKTLGLDENYDAFDHDVLSHINSAFFTLYQLGVGPEDGFSIEDDTASWIDYMAGGVSLNAVKTYVYLRVRLLFDPPTTGHHLNSLDEQRKELEHRLLMEKELESWQSPLSSHFLP